MKIKPNIIYRALASIALACFSLLPAPKAFGVSPPPGGCYPLYTTAEGCSALNFLTTGAGNTGVGWYSLFSAGAANYNTGVGAGTLVLNTASSNTAVGAAALLLNTTGSENTAVGTNALVYNDGGNYNTAIGAFALSSSTIGGNNTAVGRHSLLDNTTGTNNTAIGVLALAANTTGGDNTAVGYLALLSSNSTASNNSAFGGTALGAFLSGQANTAIGAGALGEMTTGDLNTAVGEGAGLNANGSGNVYIGQGVVGFAGEMNHTYIRNIAITPVTANPDFVTVDLTTGLLAHTSSSRRYKEDIHVMKEASEVLYHLKPVTYRFKKEIDPGQNLQYGLVAEDVAQVDRNLALRNGKGDVEDVRYTAISAMLLNEFLKEHRIVREQEAAIAELKSALVQQQRDFQATATHQQKQIEALTAGLQKVSAQIDVGRPTSQVVDNRQ